MYDKIRLVWIGQVNQHPETDAGHGSYSTVLAEEGGAVRAVHPSTSDTDNRLEPARLSHQERRRRSAFGARGLFDKRQEARVFRPSGRPFRTHR